MALKATVCKVQLQIADMDRHYYADHSLTLAQHPSENNERLMVRLLAFALNANKTLGFTKGLSGSEDEAELWDLGLDGVIAHWVEFGQVDEKWLRKACNRAKKVTLYCYGGRVVPVWWKANSAALARYQNLTVIDIPEQAVADMAKLFNRNMQIQCNISESQIWLSDATQSVLIEPEVLQQG
ncbi:YaeQ family protein [Alishewanella sp. SMS8]|uniref:YaeQ family protein n=1 Tax=Alishewanella sp. SMS8 TaxID=2994676 RepID=UPI00274287F3|nr:YaeQ family protein [Alishewanella sp. SMS8]MDP5036339.1 YaeQ family protein [Alishewanella sp.]MDP5186706.1 YaeQ family protein [Alishewanella sp.]MDP5206578.1 YaeQ family protein [Alishewanella sp. SMS9]MDP5460727.1 YaeQ family protein [Alishewanella sp. SMS8]